MRARRLLALLLIVVPLALALRLWGITREPIWADEIFSLHCSSGTAAAVLEKTAVDTHPPAYSLGLRAWRSAFGASLGWVRGYSTL